MNLQTHVPRRRPSPHARPLTLWLKKPAAPDTGDGTAPESAVQTEEIEEPLILCRECLFPVTREAAQTSMAPQNGMMPMKISFMGTPSAIPFTSRLRN